MMGEVSGAVGVGGWRVARAGMHRLTCARFLRALTLLILMLSVANTGAVARADARTGYLVKLLQGSTQFRVRAQAAISLGSAAESDEAEDALRRALKDGHPAVRAAAAASLGRLGAEGAITELRKLDEDPESPVRAAAEAAVSAISKTRRTTDPAPEVSAPEGGYYVAIGALSSKAPNVDAGQVDDARSALRGHLARVAGVKVAPERERLQDARRALQASKLKGYIIDASITGVQPRAGGGTRVAVSLVVSTYPDHDMRAILNGAATAIGGGDNNFQQALEGAIAGALKQLPQALGR